MERLGPDWHQHDAFMVMTNSALTSSVEEITADRWRIYCLTPHSESLLRWAHYADKHSGICFEFDATQEPFARAYQVLYNEALVALGPDIFDDPRGMADGVLLSKSSKWEYEDAHTRTRSFQRSGILDHHGWRLPSAPGDHAYSDHRGLQCRYERDSATSKRLRPRVRRAVRMPHKYEIEIVELDPVSTKA